MSYSGFDLFIPVIWQYIQSYNKATDICAKKKLKEGLKDSLKKWSDQPVKMVSKKVFERCNQKSPSINPFNLEWMDRFLLNDKSFDKDIKKSWLVWEHTTPLNEFFKILINCKNEIEVQVALNGYSGVCWISREEDNCLNKMKYRSHRPGGWLKCYNECGIEVIYSSSFN